MKLQQKFEKQEDIPQDLKGMYKEDNGVFVLNDIDGLVAKTQVDEFRNNNLDIAKENETLKQAAEKAEKESNKTIQELQEQMKAISEKFDGIDLEEVEKMKIKQQELHDKKTMTMPDVEALLQKRLEDANTALNKKQEESLTKHNAEIAKYQDILKLKQERLYKQTVVDTTANIANELGVVEGAMDDVANRMLTSFSLDDDDNIVGKNTDGTVMYDKDGVTKTTIRSYMTALKANELSKHLFKQSQGGDALGGGANEVVDTGNMANKTATENIASGIGKKYGKK